MKIALPSRGEMIDDHFGHCESFTVFTINEDDKIASREVIPSTNGCGCKSGIASVLRDKGVEILLAGNMGDGAMNVLASHGIAVYRGCQGNVKGITEAFLKGELSDSGESCSHHGHHGEGPGHECHH